MSVALMVVAISGALGLAACGGPKPPMTPDQDNAMLDAGTDPASPPAIQNSPAPNSPTK